MPHVSSAPVPSPAPRGCLWRQPDDTSCGREMRQHTRTVRTVASTQQVFMTLMVKSTGSGSDPDSAIDSLTLTLSFYFLKMALMVSSAVRCMRKGFARTSTRPNAGSYRYRRWHMLTHWCSRHRRLIRNTVEEKRRSRGSWPVSLAHSSQLYSPRGRCSPAKCPVTPAVASLCLPRTACTTAPPASCT